MPAPPPSPSELVGLSEVHICAAGEAEEFGARVHRDVVEPLRALRTAARAEGFDLVILSGFRSFERQLSIWNRKVAGELPVLDSDSRALDVRTLEPRELAFAILRWSALPGASRHHWGTDFDVYDANARPAGYEIELIPAECDAGGMFAPLHEWLDARIAADTSFDFFRPYDRDRGGVAPERWHLSYAPLARVYARVLTPTLLRETIERADMKLADVVLQDLGEIFELFVKNVGPEPA